MTSPQGGCRKPLQCTADAREVAEDDLIRGKPRACLEKVIGDSPDAFFWTLTLADLPDFPEVHRRWRRLLTELAAIQPAPDQKAK